jgi:hypothetical protein
LVQSPLLSFPVPRRFLYILLISISSLTLRAQSVDSSSGQNISKIVDVYYRSLGEQSPLYNGSQYIEYPFIIQDGHPFFGSQSFVNATIHFEGMTFTEVPMLYDIVRDQVVILDYHKIYKINLPTDKIQGFELSGHTFVLLVHDSLNGIKTGFYEQLYSGKIALFAKREKKFLQQYSNTEVNNVVLSKSFYYIRKGNGFYTVNSKKSLLNILKPKQKEVQQYLKKNKIKFKRDRENAALRAVEYYDQLTK